MNTGDLYQSVLIPVEQPVYWQIKRKLKYSLKKINNLKLVT